MSTAESPLSPATERQEGERILATRPAPAGPRGLWAALCRATGAMVEGATEAADTPIVDLRGTEPHLAYLASVQR